MTSVHVMLLTFFGNFNIPLVAFGPLARWSVHSERSPVCQCCCLLLLVSRSWVNSLRRISFCAFFMQSVDPVMDIEDSWDTWAICLRGLFEVGVRRNKRDLKYISPTNATKRYLPPSTLNAPHEIVTVTLDHQTLEAFSFAPLGPFPFHNCHSNPKNNQTITKITRSSH